MQARKTSFHNYLDQLRPGEEKVHRRLIMSAVKSLPNLNKTDPRSAPMRNCEMRRSGRRRADPFQVEKVNLWVREIKVKGARASSADSANSLRCCFPLSCEWNFCYLNGVLDKQWTSSGQGVARLFRRTYEIWRCRTLYHVKFIHNLDCQSLQAGFWIFSIC